MLQAEQQRIRNLLTESVIMLCKNGISYKGEFCVEGLLGITIDNAEVLLVNIKETITIPLFTANETASKVSDDIAQGLSFSFFSKDDSIKEETETILIDGCTDMDIPCSSVLLGETDAKVNHGVVEDNLTQSISDIANAYVKYEGFDDDDEPHSTLLTCIELEELIYKDNKVKDLAFETCDQIIYDGGGILKKEKLLENSDDSNGSHPESGDVLTNRSTDILLQNTRDIEQPAEWGEVMEEVAPLNLAGPQDLSTGIGKQTFICTSCGKAFNSESRLQDHSCGAPNDSDESLLLGDMAEPLNLKSQPLDLTTGRADGEPYMYSDLMEQDGFTCLCSRSYSDYQTYINHSTICSKAKLTPYKSCEICGKFFFSNSGYTKHKKLHVGEYKFHCNICHKGFFDKTHLRAHTDSSHSKVRRHACPCCKKSFFWKHHLKRHLRTCNKEEIATVTEIEDIESSSSDVAGSESQLGT